MPSILVKRGLEAALLATNPVVASGEFIYSIDTSKLKIGDGITSYSGLPVAGSGIFLQLSGGTLTGALSGTSANFSSALTSLSGSFTTNLAIGSNNLTTTNTLNIINSANLYLWSNFR